MRLLGKYLAMKALDLSPTQMTLVLAAALGGHLLQVGPDGFADGGVHTTSQPSVRGDGHVQVLRLLLSAAHLGTSHDINDTVQLS